MFTFTNMEKVSEIRERILETASRLFYEQGYNSTGINQVIAESRVAKASLYQHFSSKDDLCVEYLKRKHTTWFAQLKEYIKTAATPREKILSTFDFLKEASVRDNYRGCSFLNIISEVPNGGNRILDQARLNKKMLREHFHELSQNLGIAKAQLKADQIYLLFEGAIIESQVYRSTWPIDLSKELAEDILS